MAQSQDYGGSTGATGGSAGSAASSSSSGREAKEEKDSLERLRADFEALKASLEARFGHALE
jgi:hypothetical protein